MICLTFRQNVALGSIQTIHKQTDHDQTGLNLDELIWDELALV